MGAGTGVLEATRDAVSTLLLVSHGADRLREGRETAVALVAKEKADEGLVLRGAHPDLIELLSPERGKVGIDQVREAVRQGQFTPVQGARKVCLVPRAEDLTPEAANALLKALEEPPRNLVFLLLAEAPGSLLPTIVSRSRVVRSPASLAATLAALADLGYREEEARYVVAAATRQGDLDPFLAERIDLTMRIGEARQALREADASRLLAAATGEGPVRRREGVSALLDRLAQGDVRLAVAAARGLSAGREAREVVLGFLEDLLSVTASLLRSAVGLADELLSGGGSAAGTGSEGRLRRSIRAADRARRAAEVYTPLEPVLLSLFLSAGGIGRG
jgi:hypothetical protein